MKKQGLYQVYDSVGQTAITQPIPCTNKLTACLGFYNSYMREKDPKKNPYKYEALDLICIGEFEIDEDGIWTKFISSDFKISGFDVKQFISSEMAALGVKDPFELEEEGE